MRCECNGMRCECNGMFCVGISWWWEHVLKVHIKGAISILFL